MHTQEVQVNLLVRVSLRSLKLIWGLFVQHEHRPTVEVVDVCIHTLMKQYKKTKVEAEVVYIFHSISP